MKAPLFDARLYLSVLLITSSACTLFSGGLRELPIEAVPVVVDGAVTAYYRGSVEESLDRLREHIEREPDDRTAFETFAWIERERGNFPEAARLYQALLEQDPEYAEAKRELFITLSAAGDTEKAERLLPKIERDPRTLPYEALLNLRLGRIPEAEENLRSLLGQDENRPIAWYALGRILVSRDPAEAESCFKKAVKGDANLTAALPYLTETLLVQGKLSEALTLLRRIRNILPERADLAEKLAALEAVLGESDKELVSAEKRSRAVPPKAAPLAQEGPAMPVVRIGLAERLKSVTLKTGGPFRIAASGRDEAVTGAAGEVLTVRAEGASLTVLRGEGDEIASASGNPLSLECFDGESTTLVFDLTTEEGSFYAVSEDRAYRGVLEFRPGEKGLTLVNILGLEEYLAGVVPAEMPSSWPMEALRAQAIAARSYTLASLGAFVTRGFDLYGSVLSAAYRGAGGETKRATEAIAATRGKVLLAGGRPVKAYYSSNHGGYGENSASVWGTEDFMQAVPDGLAPPRDKPLAPPELDKWLKAKPAAYSARPPYTVLSSYRWEKWVAASDIAARIRREKDVGRILAIVPRGRGISGRLKEAEIVGTAGTVRVSGDRIRSRLGGLRSSLFTYMPILDSDGFPEYFVFTGGGWGHGVGLDQCGAAGMAAAGFSAEEILLHYYPRAAIGTYGR